jgi:hypothetical protein
MSPSSASSGPARLFPGALLLVFLVPPALGAQDRDGAQLARTTDAAGFVHLRWAVPEPAVTGQPFRARWTVLNPTGTPLALEVDPCAVGDRVDQVTGGLPFYGPMFTCSPGARSLAPGDSAWVEFRATLLAPPGALALGDPFDALAVEILPGDGTGAPLPEELLDPPDRIPVVLELVVPAGHPVSRERVHHLLDDAAGDQGVVLDMDEAAARAQVQTASWLRLRLASVEGEPAGLELSACWQHPEDGANPCAAFRTTITAPDAEALLSPTGPLRRRLTTLLSLRSPMP